MRAFWFLTMVVAAGAVWAEGADAGLTKQEQNAWHFRVGPVMSPRARVRVHVPRPVLPAFPATGTMRSGTLGAVAADPSAGYTARNYTDGSVSPDEGTQDAMSMISGLTWNWSADDVGAQLVGDQLEFRTEAAKWTEVDSISTYQKGAGREYDRDILLGLEAMGGWTFFDGSLLTGGLDAGFRYYGSGDLHADSKYGARVTTTRRQYRYVDRYDASGWTDSPKGSHSGTAGGPGRLLGAKPTRSEEEAGTSTSTRSYDYRSYTKVNYDIWDLRLGPTLGVKVTDAFAVRGGVYGLLGLVDAQLKTHTSSTEGAQAAKKSTCDPVFGLAAALSAQFNFTDSLFLSGGVEYDWWADSMSLSAGGADAHLKLSDFTVSLSVGIDF